MRISDWSSDVCSSDLLLSIFYIVDGAYFAANMTKVPDGGWFPLLVGLVIFTLLTTWAKGRQLMLDRMREAAMPIPVFVASAANSAVRVPGQDRKSVVSGKSVSVRVDFGGRRSIK